MSLNTSRRLLFGASAFSMLAFSMTAPAFAQDKAAAEKPASDQRIEDDLHDRRVDTTGDIVVTAAGLTQLDMLSGTSVVEGAELQRNLNGQLGDVLVKLPGVSATGFSPGASRPVLRGFSGERVKVLTDGIGAIDASNTSDDHAVTIDPLTAERIEVLRGPAVILYGSQAIGGAVNVISKRIPQRVPGEPFHLDTVTSADTATGLREGGASLDVPIGDHFVVHANGSYRHSDDIDIPGFAATPALRAQALADADAKEAMGDATGASELREAALVRGTLPDSAAETWSADVGFAFFEGDSNLGAAVGVYDSAYGVPGRPGGEENVSIDLHQTRADLRGTLDLGDGFFSELKTRVGYSDYTHTELEGTEVGTVFKVSGIESRAELVQNPTNNWHGSLGIQYYFRDFEAIGDEAFIAPNMTDQFAVFGLQEVDIGNFQVEGALRYETTKVGSQQLGVDRQFDALSGAVSFTYETDSGLRIGVNGSRAERAPSAEELFSNGAHIATQSFESGDINLVTEKSWGVEGFVRGDVGPAAISFSVYNNWFSDYISLFATGVEQDDLPVFQYLQRDVTYFGIEGEVNYTLIDTAPLSLKANLRGDYIKAELADGTPLPRIPPLSLLGALEAETDSFDVRAEVQWFDSQNAVAPFETTTGSFTMVNASVAWRPFSSAENITLMLQADNIFDVEGRRHASFTKDFVPLTGRNFKVSLKTSF